MHGSRTIGNTGSRGREFHTCSSGLSLECTAEQDRFTPEEERNTPRGVGPVRALGEVNDEFIVRFKEYRHASEFKEALKEKLEGNGRVWQWLERNNPASAFPTDFALLRIKRTQYEDILEALRKLEFVKDVSPQMRFTRSLTSEKSEDAYTPTIDDEGLDGKDEEFELNDKEEMAGRKPPGRLRTRLSFESEFEDATTPLLANISLNHDRKLLLQVMSLCFLFESTFVWSGAHPNRSLPCDRTQ